MPSRCIAVLSIPRAGSSCVAGVLHKLGVDMGAGHFQPKDTANRRGYFEDMRWRLATQRVTGKGYSLRAARIARIGKKQRQMYRSLAQGRAGTALWGMKDPWLAFVGQFIWPILREQGIDVWIVAVHRKREASVASVAAHLRKTYKNRGNADQIVATWRRGFCQRLEEFHGPVCSIYYELLVRKPRREIERLAAFAFDGLDARPTGDLRSIAQWVTPKLKHH